MADTSFARLQRREEAQRRALRAALLGLPAVIVLTLSIVGLNQARLRVEQGDIRSRYLRAAHQSLRGEDWEQAELFNQKLAALRPGDPVAQYGLAACAHAQGNEDRAVRLMEQIAPADAPGYPPAQWWLARHFSAQPPSPTTLHRCRRHLHQYLAEEPRDYAAHLLMGQLELRLGHQEAAVRHFEQAAHGTPQARLAVARVLGRLGRVRAAQSHARRTAEWYQQHLLEQPQDVEARLHLADALTMLRDTAGAAEVLQAGRTMEDDPRLGAGLVRVCLVSLDALQREPATEENVAQQLKLIEQALELSPEEPRILKRLAQLAVATAGSYEEPSRLLEVHLASGTAPAVVHMILGAHAIANEEPQVARLHFETADRLQPGFPACLNNLAWSLAHLDPPELDQALRLVDLAIARSPERAEFRDTRGQILVRMGRYEEALPELELGLQGAGDLSGTHACLSTVYEQLGQRELAELHRERARTNGP